ncbi:MAG: DEAD/DEAH box helicase [Chitinispirillia bacterium]|jgi:superfamily II DNA or RNA helicase
MPTLRDRLAHLNFQQALKLLGKNGKKLIILGGKYDIDISEQVEMSNNVFRLKLHDCFVSIVEDNYSVKKMRYFCSECEGVCEHIGAAFSLILEEKTVLGLAKPPEDDEPLQLTDKELMEREILRRKDRAKNERMVLSSTDKNKIWTDYIISSKESGKSYRIALRGWERGESFCSCPDFRKNTLGTCKHILYALNSVKKRFSLKKRGVKYVPDIAAVYLKYGKKIELFLQLPPDAPLEVHKHFSSFLNIPITDISSLILKISQYINDGGELTIYPDAEQFINIKMHKLKINDTVKDISSNLENHAYRKNLLKAELLPYQLEGIAFVLGCRRAVIADDMGLGKTIQGIGSAELFARECGIKKVLIISPASVKSQWRTEIKRFSNRDCQIVIGSAEDRVEQYNSNKFFTICNYEQVLRDLQTIELIPWDFIILDEGQRIKNWQAKTSQTIKGLRSPYALVLSGTPLENRLEELYSVVEFIDDRHLGPAFRFYHEHQFTDEKGRVLGYKNLEVLRNKLKPILLRRTRNSVMKQLPPRTTEIIRITPTDEQAGINATQIQLVGMIVKKAYISEMDLLRLQKALLMARLSADSTFLVNKEKPGYSSKLEKIEELLPALASEEDRKVIIFSEWTTMLTLIEEILRKHALRYVRLDGSVPQKKRAGIVHEFQNDPLCTFFLATNAGATGLNLQAANTVVNVDLPWNPAILEQRIGRAHRMGQKRPVQIYLLVTEDTIEEGMLRTLALKHDLADAAINFDSDITKVDLQSGLDELKKRLEIILGEKPEAPPDVSEKERVLAESVHLAKKRKVEEAGGNLLTAAFTFAGEMINVDAADENVKKMTKVIRESFEQCLDKDDNGRMSIRFTLPDSNSLDMISSSLAKFLSVAKNK